MRNKRLDSSRRLLIKQAGQLLLQGQDEQAFVLLNAAMHLVEPPAALCNADIAECLTLMGTIRLKAEEAKEAESYLSLALFIYQRCGESLRNNILQLVPLLILACRRQGKFSKARELEKEFLSSPASAAAEQVAQTFPDAPRIEEAMTPPSQQPKSHVVDPQRPTLTAL